MCFTISTAGFRTNNLFVSAQLIYLLSPAADRLLFYPFLPPAPCLNTSAARFVTTKLVLFVLKVEIKLAEHRTPFPLLFKYKDLQATLFIDQDSTLHSESGATRRTATGNGMIK